MTTKNICIFGDSIAYGAWSRTGGWVDRLRTELQQQTLDSKFQSYYFLYNLSIPGNTTEDLLKRFVAESNVRAPHIIIFAIGINDASCRDQKEKPRVDTATFINNVRSLFKEAKKQSKTVACIGLSRVDEHFTTPFENTYFVNKKIGEYDVVLKNTCAEEGILWLDISTLLGKEDLADGLHPNDQGHEKIFRAVYDFLKPTLSEK